MVKLFLVLLMVFVLIVLSESAKKKKMEKKPMLKCFTKFDNQVDYNKATETCLSSLNIESFPNYDRYTSPGFDDKCLAKCVLTELGLVKGGTAARIQDYGSLDMEAYLDMIEDHAPKSLIPKLKQTGEKCSSSSGVEKIEKNVDCKAYGKFQGCFLTYTKKIC